MQTEWVLRWKTWVSQTPVKPGIWKCRDGGWLARSQAKDPRTGKMVEIRKRRNDETAEQAEAWLVTKLEEIRRGGPEVASTGKPRFIEFAYSLLEKKVATFEINSAKGRDKWLYVLKHLEKRWGDYFMDAISYPELDVWRTEAGLAVKAGKTKPTSFNTVLSVFRVIMTHYYRERRLPGNPMLDIKPLPLKAHRTYTKEQPNSLLPDEMKPFLTAARQLFPQHFCMIAFGFFLGQRPSTLRPLRRKGPHADLSWSDGLLLIRRSVTNGEVMDTTKNGEDSEIRLPNDLIDLAAWHVKTQLTNEAMLNSDLLFPSVKGGFRAPSVLDKPLDEIARVIGLKKNISARAMRRTHKDLSRFAEINAIVQRSIVGHLTEEMDHRYSSVNPAEQKAALTKVLSLAGFREAADIDAAIEPRKRKKMGKGTIEHLRKGDES